MLLLLLVLSDLAAERILDLLFCDLPSVIETYRISFGKEACNELGRIRTELLKIELLDRVDVRIVGLLACVNELVVNELLVDA